MTPNPMSEREVGYGVQPVEELVAEHEKHESDRAKLATEHQSLWSLYGPGGTADTVRKNEELRLSAMVRAMAVATRKEGEKLPTEGAIEEGARSHPDYLGLVAKITTDRARFAYLESELQRLERADKVLEWRFNRGQAVLRNFAREPQ